MGALNSKPGWGKVEELFGKFLRTGSGLPVTVVDGPSLAGAARGLTERAGEFLRRLKGAGHRTLYCASHLAATTGISPGPETLFCPRYPLLREAALRSAGRVVSFEPSTASVSGERG